MCGLFGHFSDGEFNAFAVSRRLAKHNRRRGQDSSGVLFQESRNCGALRVERSDGEILDLLKKLELSWCPVFAGHSRLITHGHGDNQPVTTNNVIVFHNGVITNLEEAWRGAGRLPNLEIDSEVIAGIAETELMKGTDLGEIPEKILDICEGSISCAMFFPNLKKAVLFTNTGSLYTGIIGNTWFFSSERFPLIKEGMTEVSKVEAPLWFDLANGDQRVRVTDHARARINLVPPRKNDPAERELLDLDPRNLRRCTQCILPETMPFLAFNSKGVCNFCLTHSPLGPKSDESALRELVSARSATNSKSRVVIPLSGGRDSSFGLYYAKEVLGLDPVAFTYDWGMVTDVGRRNASRMCAELGVEHIIVSADIEKKRAYVRQNLLAWLRKPHLGMLNLMMAGDKHFFKFLEIIKRETRISTAFWSTNPLEVTHFKSGFLGVPPNVPAGNVFSTGLAPQISYQTRRLIEMIKNPSYFNRSLFDTLSGEYYRSIKKTSGNLNLFNFVQWDEQRIDSFIDDFGWERDSESGRSWRNGDGTSSFYNYVYGRVAGFTENDTFRSNQIREGAMTRSMALDLIEKENVPDYLGIRWYLDVLGLPFTSVIEQVNSIPRMRGFQDRPKE